jgi:hypothetical protein
MSCSDFISNIFQNNGPVQSLVQGPGSRVQGPGSRVQGPGSRVQGPGSRVQGPGSRVQGPGSGVQGPGSRVQGTFYFLYQSSLYYRATASRAYRIYLHGSHLSSNMHIEFLRSSKSHLKP